MKKYFFLLFLVLVFPIISCTYQSSFKYKNKLHVVTVSYPTASIVENLITDDIELVELGNNKDPHDFELSTKDRKYIEDADLVIIIGSRTQPSFEKLKDKRFILISQIDAIEKYRLNQEKNNNQVVYDPHVWLSLDFVNDIAKTISKEFVSRDIQNKSQYLKKLKTFIDNNNKLINSIPKNCKQKNVITYHSSLNYLVKEFGQGIVNRSVSGINSHDEPTIESIENIKNQIIKNKIKYILFDSKQKILEKILSDTQAKKVHFSTIEIRKNNQTYFELQSKNLDSISKALECSISK